MPVRGTIGQRHSENETETTAVDDGALREGVLRAFNRHKDIDTTQVTVEVHNGEVFLRGAADSLAEKLEIERVADDVEGIVAVNNSLRVRRNGD